MPALRDPGAVRPLPVVLDALAAETSAAGVPTELEVTGASRGLAPESKERAERLGGHVDFDTTPGGGLTLRVTVPG